MKGFRPQPQQPMPGRTPVGARTYTELRRRILHGELPSGALLSEADLAALLGVSRTPVREALRELLNEGLVEDGPRRQVVVATASPQLNREVQLMRGALERLAIREATTTRDVSDLDQLRLIMIRTRRALAADDINTYLDCDDEFHLLIARTAGLPIVEDVLRRLRGFTRLAGLTIQWDPEHLQRSADQHDAIIDALETGDPDTAETALADHLEFASATLAAGTTGRA